MTDHIHYMHNETDGKLIVQKRNSGGQYSQIAEIPPDDKGGPYSHISLSDLRFVTQTQKPVYFRFVRRAKDGDITHMDGQTGHPGGGNG